MLNDLEEVSLRDADLNALGHFFKVFLASVEERVPERCMAWQLARDLQVAVSAILSTLPR